MLEQILRDATKTVSLSFSGMCGYYVAAHHLYDTPREAFSYFLMAGYVPFLMQGLGVFTDSFFSERARKRRLCEVTRSRSSELDIAKGSVKVAIEVASGPAIRAAGFGICFYSAVYGAFLAYEKLK